jgi:hypothetical protein
LWDRLFTFCTALHYTLHYTTLHYTTLHYSSLDHTLHYTALNHTNTYFSTRIHTTLHCTPPQSEQSTKAHLLNKAARWMDKMLRVFGVVVDTSYGFLSQVCACVVHVVCMCCGVCVSCVYVVWCICGVRMYQCTCAFACECMKCAECSALSLFFLYT